jgi:hypothetical protein
MQDDLIELSADKIDMVSGGWATVGLSIFANAAYDAAKGFGNWFMDNKAGGADEGTWERIGQSQMTA